MLYLLFALTFLAGILFYGMTPRDDKLHMDVNQSEGMIISFLNQHQAAKDYLYAWMGVNANNRPDSNVRGDNRNFLRAKLPNNGADSDQGIFDFSMWFPSGIVGDTCADSTEMNQGDPGLSGHPSGCFVSRVVCTDVNKNRVNDCSAANVKNRYLVTYGGWEGCNNDGCFRPSWWPAESVRVRRFERWRKAIAKRTRGSVSCGTLYENPSNSNEWCIDNGDKVFKDETQSKKQCINSVPSSVINALPYAGNKSQLDDLLICFSKVKQGLGDYVSGLTHFYDGFSNIDYGRHTDADSTSVLGSANAKWTDLTGNQDILSVNWKSNKNTPYLTMMPSTGTRLNTNITLGATFTLTVLVNTPSNGSTAATLLGWNNGSDVEIFKKIVDNGSDMFWLNKLNSAPEDLNEESACNNGPDKINPDNPVTKDRIISWTFVVDACEGSSDRCITVYENAARHDGGVISGPIQNPNGQKLLLSTNDVLKVYGIRYYSRALTPSEIQQNFKVDQKRFGIADFNNGESKACQVDARVTGGSGGKCQCEDINAGGA